VLKGRRLWAVQNTNQVTRIRLDRDLTSGVVEKVITSDRFQTPSTAGHRLRDGGAAGLTVGLGVAATRDRSRGTR
jgi:hypothetical protein